MRPTICNFVIVPVTNVKIKFFFYFFVFFFFKLTNDVDHLCGVLHSSSSLQDPHGPERRRLVSEHDNTRRSTGMASDLLRRAKGHHGGGNAGSLWKRRCKLNASFVSFLVLLVYKIIPSNIYYDLCISRKTILEILHESSWIRKNVIDGRYVAEVLRSL